MAAVAGGHRLGQPHSIGRLLAEVAEPAAPRPRVVLLATARQQSSDVGQRCSLGRGLVKTNFQTLSADFCCVALHPGGEPDRHGVSRTTPTTKMKQTIGAVQWGKSGHRNTAGDMNKSANSTTSAKFCCFCRCWPLLLLLLLLLPLLRMAIDHHTKTHTDTKFTD